MTIEIQPIADILVL